MLQRLGSLLLASLAKERLDGLSWKLLESLLAGCWEGGRLLRELLRRSNLGGQLWRGCLPRELLLCLAWELLLCLAQELLLLLLRSN